MNELRKRINATIDDMERKKLQYCIAEKPNQFQLFELANLRRELRYLLRLWNSLE
jgi:hypothetical protein